MHTLRASMPSVSNQSIESIITAIVKVSDCSLPNTSLISSVWILTPSNACGFDSLV